MDFSAPGPTRASSSPSGPRGPSSAVVRMDGLGVRVVLRFHETTPVPPQRLADLISSNPRRFTMSNRDGSTKLVVRFTPAEWEWPFRFLHWVFRELERSETS